MYKFLNLVSRLFISLIFIVSAISKAFTFDVTIAYMQSYHMSNASAFLVIAIIIEILGGLSILLGVKARHSALVLLIFVAIVTCVFHLDFSQAHQRAEFFKNLAIMGALLSILLHGSGPWSLCSRDF